MRQLDESAVPACVYVEKRGKQSTEITRCSIDTPNSPWPQSGLHSADLTGEILKMKLPQMPGQLGVRHCAGPPPGRRTGKQARIKGC
jgi:hypothetical protein